jgi:hypothetical protein
MPLGFTQRARPGTGEREVTPRATATNGKWLTMSRREQTFVFESL